MTAATPQRAPAPTAPGPDPGPAGGDAARAALLVLADGRFPAGGHAHSGGVEAAVRHGAVTGPEDLAAFCIGRLATAGLVAAALAAAAAAGADPLALDTAADARTPSPALRSVSRRLGRQLMRAARTAWPCDALENLASARPRGAHQPVVLGVTAAAAGLGPADAALAAAHESVSGPAAAAVRLLGLDPFATTAVLARLAPRTDEVVRLAVACAADYPLRGPHALPAASAPLLDLYAEDHATWPVRLFTS